MIITIDTTTGTISLVKAYRAIAKFEQSLEITATGNLRPTIKFLGQVSGWLRDNGFNDATLSAAWQFWIIVNRLCVHSKDTIETDAEVAFWYGIDASKLSEIEKLGFIQNVDKLRCRKRIADGDFAKTDYEGVYYLYLTAFEDEQLAQKMKSKAFAAYVEEKTRKQGVKS
ncbi:hypothetical protein VN12_04405 [Pirellula sp. SH-Sr6A]|uniref:hypothetical protein n=1 Tax=Pirellula sp. SH-Sr6A TaxID=1632865 RepID=UPI00078E4CC9|nr:hypothetical protein [Pirellula sp. SH-Sr6A]AMV31335.1 hypothetical protein VN12_04405 [Pirellula sp. SH-Sr6A]